MNETNATAADSVAATYYDSQDADRFYEQVWGGEDIHIGLYAAPDEAIATASDRTVHALLDLASQLPQGGCVVDLGAGYGGASRRLARWSQRPVHAINISTVENDRHRQLNVDAGLEQRITVHDASFEQVPVAEASADLVWSLDAILHAGDRARVFLGGVHDPMAGWCGDLADPCVTRFRYKAWGEAVGLMMEVWDERTEMLVQHYNRVRQDTRSRRAELETSISAGYLDRMDVGLGHWVDGGQKGSLCWGLMRLRKPG